MKTIYPNNNSKKAKIILSQRDSARDNKIKKILTIDLQQKAGK